MEPCVVRVAHEVVKRYPGLIDDALAASLGSAAVDGAAVIKSMPAVTSKTNKIDINNRLSPFIFGSSFLNRCVWVMKFSGRLGVKLISLSGFL